MPVVNESEWNLLCAAMNGYVLSDPLAAACEIYLDDKKLCALGRGRISRVAGDANLFSVMDANVNGLRLRVCGLVVFDLEGVMRDAKGCVDAGASV